MIFRYQAELVPRGGMPSFGLIAENVAEVFPELEVSNRRLQSRLAVFEERLGSLA